MTTAEIAALLGKTATYRCNGLDVAVKILDARAVFGRIDYQITPVAGSGSAWVQSLAIDEEEVQDEQ